MKISLVVLSSGKAAGKALPIALPQFLIGRDPQCNLRPASAMISKRHCAVLTKNDAVYVRDMESTNGTYVNDKQVKGEVQVKDGDVLKIGPLLFKLAIEVEAVVKTQAAAPVVAAAPATVPVAKSAPADSIDDDVAAAAALLDLDEKSGDVKDVSSTTDTAEDKMPDGTTIMDIPVIPEGATVTDSSMLKDAAQAAASQEPAAADKPEQKKEKPKHKTGAAQDAAKAILDKLRTGKRK